MDIDDSQLQDDIDAAVRSVFADADGVHFTVAATRQFCAVCVAERKKHRLQAAKPALAVEAVAAAGPSPELGRYCEWLSPSERQHFSSLVQECRQQPRVLADGNWMANGGSCLEATSCLWPRTQQEAATGETSRQASNRRIAGIGNA